MVQVEQGQFWDVYSARQNCWSPAVVVQIEGSRAKLRYLGFVEFVNVDTADLSSKPQLYREARPVPEHA